jgi:hypothetical protein
MSSSYFHRGYRKLSENILFWSRLMAHGDQGKHGSRLPAKSSPRGEGGGPEPAAIEEAAEALRKVEIEAVDPGPFQTVGVDLDSMNIDQLRVVAKQLDVPDRETITESDELVAAIRQHLGA